MQIKGHLQVGPNVSVDIRCMQETKFRGQSVRITKVNATGYKLLRIGNGS